MLKCEFCREEAQPLDPRHTEGRCAIWTKGWTPAAADRSLLMTAADAMRLGYPARDVI